MTLLEAPGSLVSVFIPAGSLPENLAGFTITASVTNVELASTLAPSAEIRIIRAVEVKIQIDGEEVDLDYNEPAILRFPLTPTELEVLRKNPSAMAVFHLNSEGDWDILPTTFKETPFPPHLEATVTGFSIFAIGIYEGIPPAAAPTSTPRPTALPVPIRSVGSTPAAQPIRTMAPTLDRSKNGLWPLNFWVWVALGGLGAVSFAGLIDFINQMKKTQRP